jgi:ABC-type nitrate/sulfonate/bicarbonate transport system substrate-binding protein
MYQRNSPKSPKSPISPKFPDGQGIPAARSPWGGGGQFAIARRIRQWTLAAAGLALLMPLGAQTPSASAAAAGANRDLCAALKPGAAPAKPTPIRYGITGSGEEPLALLWADKASYPNNGKLYSLEPLEFAPTDRMTALQAGQLDAGTISFPALLAAVHAGIDARAVATLVEVNKEDNEGAFAALADSGIRSVKDLKGKRIGYYGPNTISEFWVKSALVRAGMSPRDVSFVAMPPPAQEQALRNKQIDVAWLARQFLHKAKETGGLQVMMTPFEAVNTNQPSLLIMFSPKFVQANPQAFCAWRADYQRALKTWIAQRESLYPKLIQAKYLTPFAANAGPDGGRIADGSLSLAELNATVQDMITTRFLPPPMQRPATELVLTGYALLR